MSTRDPVEAERLLGARWEKNWGVQAIAHGREFIAFQLGRDTGAAVSWRKNIDAPCYHVKRGQPNQRPCPDGTCYAKQLMPDTQVLNQGGEYHEIKHKKPDKRERFGLEDYRLTELVRLVKTTGQTGVFTIHNHGVSPGGKYGTVNRIEDWVYADVRKLAASWTAHNNYHPSLVDGELQQNVWQRFWNVQEYFRPLAELWTPPTGL